MLLNNASSFPVDSPHLRQSEEENLVDVHQLVGPELIFVEDVSAEQLGRNTAG